MSADLAPGDWVQCIDDRPDIMGDTILVLNAVYCVARLYDNLPDLSGRYNGPGAAVDLVDIPRPSRGRGRWAVERFRPLGGHQTDTTTQQSAPAPAIREPELTPA